MDVDRSWNEVESECRCWINVEFSFAAEFVAVNFHVGLESAVLMSLNISTMSL